MPAAVPLGGHSAIEAHGYDRDRRRVKPGRRARQWRARSKFRRRDGVVVDITRWADTKQAAQMAVQVALRDLAHQASDLRLRPSSRFLDVGTFWLEQIERPESGLSIRTRSDYRRAYARYFAAPGSPFRGLTLQEANDVQRVIGFLQRLADDRGTGAAKLARTVLSSMFAMCLKRGVLESNAALVSGAAKARVPRSSGRDRKRSMTRDERNKVIAVADARASAPGLNPRSIDKWSTVADAIAVMAGTGCRINEARVLRWDDVDFPTCQLHLRGTKSMSSDRLVSMPDWLRDRLVARRATMTRWSRDIPLDGPMGPYVFGIDPREVVRNGLIGLTGENRPLDQSNLAGAVRQCLDDAGLDWAVPHTFRRTVASMLHQGGVPLSRIADQLGHSDPALTARVYLGRDLQGDKADLAALL